MLSNIMWVALTADYAVGGNLVSGISGKRRISSLMMSVSGLPVSWLYFSSFSISLDVKFTVSRLTAHFLLILSLR